jgi:hypothetical protein
MTPSDSRQNVLMRLFTVERINPAWCRVHSSFSRNPVTTPPVALTNRGIEPMKRVNNVCAVLAIAATLAAAPVAFAAQNDHRGHGGHNRPPVGSSFFNGGAAAYGTVATDDTTGFTVTTPTGATVTVATTSTTKFQAANPTDEATFQAGDAVVALGSFVNGFTANAVRYDSTAFSMGRGQAYSGIGVSNTATQLVVTVGTTPDTFTLNGNTKFWVNGASTAAASVPSVTGDKVRLEAVPVTDGSWVALGVSIRLPKS